MKRPSFQFYPSDWRKDMALQSCSVAARGLWVDMLCIAHECEPYGHLTVNGRPMTAAQVGRHTGLTERECVKLIAELEDAGVFSRTDDGAIYSRRMVADEDLRQRRAKGGEGGSEYGIKGAEHGKKGGRPPKARGVSKPPLNPPPSSSSSFSEAIASDGAGAPSPVDNPPSGNTEQPPDAATKAEVWHAAIAVLQAGGCASEQLCRSFLGKLVTDWTFATVREAVAIAAVAQPADAREYLLGTCRRLRGQGQTKAVPWQQSRSGIEAMGESLGLGRWDQRAADLGQGEPFTAYEARVLAAVGNPKPNPNPNPGPVSMADVVGKVVSTC